MLLDSADPAEALASAQDEVTESLERYDGELTRRRRARRDRPIRLARRTPRLT